MSETEEKLFEDNGPEDEVEMTFWDHLEELRWRLIYSIIGVFIGMLIAWIFIDFLIEKIFLFPARHAGFKLQNLKPFGQLILYFQVAIILGVIISLPNIIYQFWKFISPALKRKEKKYIKWIVLFTSFCFLSGMAFAYYVILPFTLKFAAGFGAVENNFALEEYFTLILSVLLAAGIVFELPMLSFFLSKIGILKPEFMRKYRRHSVVIIMILAAFLSPGTDPVSMLLLAVPLVFLYEISIFVSKLSQKKT